MRHGDSHKSGNCPGDKRSERRLNRWKRREAMNVSLKQNCFVSATRTSVKSCGNVSADKNNRMTGDEEKDDDYITYLNDKLDKDLDGYLSDNHSPGDNNVCGSNIAVNDEMDEDYALFLNGHLSDNHSLGDNNVCGSNIVVNDKVDEDYALFLDGYLSNNHSPRDNNVCGSNIAVNDEVDEDYALFLDGHLSDNHSPGDNNVCGSNIVVNGEVDEDYAFFLDGYLSDGGGEVDDDYITYLDTHNSDIDSAYGEMDEDRTFLLGKYVSDNDSPSDHIRYEGEEEQEEERFHKNLKLDTKMSKDLNVENDGVNEDYELFPNSGSIDAISLANMDKGLIGKRSSVRQNSQVSDRAFYTHKVHRGVDEDYQEILNSLENLEFMSDKITIKTSNVEDRSNSSDSDLIIWEPSPICENTPFVSSKTYDSSFFEKEGNPRDGRGLYADDHSPFRRRLMECLERPYDQQEYVEFMNEVIQPKQKERHLDLRKVVKSYRTKEVSKSYLELYPDLLNAIAELKDERPKVLFLLRGFFFWLQNLSHEGVFRPWDDESCLETLRKL